MILGIGIDSVAISRIETSIQRFGDRFLNRCFTATELERAASQPENRTAILAKRFAAKEALAKAIGTGIANGVGWHDFTITNAANGAPNCIIRGRALELLLAKIPENHLPDIHLSLSDDIALNLAQAFVVISTIIATDTPEKII